MGGGGRWYAKMRLTSDVAKFSRYMESAASTAPPPITTVLDSSTRLTTHSASCMERSISSHMKSLAPRSMIDAAVRLFGLKHKVKQQVSPLQLFSVCGVQS